MLQKMCTRNLVRKYCRGLTPERKVQVTNAWVANVQVGSCCTQVMCVNCPQCKLFFLTATAASAEQMLLSLGL